MQPNPQHHPPPGTDRPPLPKPTLTERLEWITALGGALGVLSPLDLVPDIIPLLGQMDDALYALVALVSALLACRQRRARRALSADLSYDGQLVFPGFAQGGEPWQKAKN